MSELIIKPKKTINLRRDLKEIFTFRELLYFLSWRDLKVRYKQTAIGVGWALFQPFITMVIFSFFFGNLAKMPSDGVPYPIFVYTGLLLWQFFSTSLSDASESLIRNQAIITKVYFPRLLFPISAVATKLIDFAIASLILIAMMLFYGYTPNLVGLLILPLLVLISFIAALGLGTFTAALSVRYRDVRYILPFFIQLMMFVTPVIYPASILGKYSKILALNPMTGVIKAARGALLGNEPINWLLLAISGIAGIMILIVGWIYFKKTEKSFTDII
jgi:lipopolysaccharide transport system permease protein